MEEKSMTELDRLRDALERIKAMTDADNPNSYRADDREGCLDTVFAVASQALADGSGNDK
jgi:hypothetical protein